MTVVFPGPERNRQACPGSLAVRRIGQGPRRKGTGASPGRDRGDFPWVLNGVACIGP